MFVLTYVVTGIPGLNTCGESPKNRSLIEELKMRAVEKPSITSSRNQSPTVAVIRISMPSNEGT